MSDRNYINPYSDVFTSRLIKAKEQREKQLDVDACDVVKSRRCNGLQFSTNSSDSTYLHSSMKTFVSRPLSACKIRSSSDLNSYDKEPVTRNRSVSTTSRYKDGEKNVFEHLSNLAKKNSSKFENNLFENKNNNRPLSSSSSSSSSALKPWIPSGGGGKSNNNTNGKKIYSKIKKTNHIEKIKNSKLMNDLYVYANTNTNTNTKINVDNMYTPTSNYIYNDDYSFNITYNKTLRDVDIYSEMIQNKHVSKTIVSQNNFYGKPYKKVTKESSRVALSGYLIDKSTAIETCRQGILLLNRGASSDELILAIRQQFGCHNISDVIVNFKSKKIESPISRSYSMDKLEELPPMNENCEFIAYIGGSAIIDGTQNNNLQNELDYDYRGLRDRLAKKLHSFSIGNSPINDGYHSNNDILSITTIDTDTTQNHQKLKYKATDLTSKSPALTSEKPIEDASSVQDQTIMTPSLQEKIETSTSSLCIGKKSQKAIVQSLLATSNENKPKISSALSSLFPYRSSINQNSNNSNNNNNNNSHKNIHSKINHKIKKNDDDHSIISTTSVSTFNNTVTTVSSMNINNDNNTTQNVPVNATKPKIKFQLDLCSLLDD